MKNEIKKKGRGQLTVVSSRSAIYTAFKYCVLHILQLDSDALDHIDLEIDSRNPDEDWFDPYFSFLRERGLDIVFFKHEPPLLINQKVEELPKEIRTVFEDSGSDSEYVVGFKDYTFHNLPTGLGIFMGGTVTDQGMLKCVVGLIDEDKKYSLRYDPYPDTEFTEVSCVGYFIKTFTEVLDEDSKKSPS